MVSSLAAIAIDVLANAIENDNRIVHGEANHREQGRQEERINFPAQEVSGQRHQAEHDQGVVHEGNDRAGAVAEGIGTLRKAIEM